MARAPRRLLRVFVSIIFKLLFVSALDVFLISVACAPQSPHSPVCVLYNFPEVEFASASNLVHGCIGILMCMSMITISFLVSLSDSEQNMLSNELLSTMDSNIKIRAFTCALARLPARLQ